MARDGGRCRLGLCQAGGPRERRPAARAVDQVSRALAHDSLLRLPCPPRLRGRLRGRAGWGMRQIDEDFDIVTNPGLPLPAPPPHAGGEAARLSGSPIFSAPSLSASGSSPAFSPAPPPPCPPLPPPSPTPP